MSEIINNKLVNGRNNDKIHTHPCPDCYLCNSKGKLLYRELEDRLFGVPGMWNFKKCPNLECGLIWLDPMPTEKDIGKAYQIYYTHHPTEVKLDNWLRHVYQGMKNGYLANKYGYLNGNVNFFYRILSSLIYLHPGYRADLDFSVFYLQVCPHDYLLEIGCGNGEMLKLMQDLGWQVEGIDFDIKAVQLAKAKGLNVHLGTFADQKFPDNIFNAIVMSHLIEHVSNPYELLQECHRVLKTGGYLVVITPNSSSWGHHLYGSDWRGLEPPRHLYLFNPQSLGCLIEKSGFQTFEVSTTIRDANNLFLACRLIQRSGGREMGGFQPRITRIWARGMQLIEWAILKVKPYVGEEIALIARKQ
jgi:2-polyprenyl-3-methyl-5-hydroxy-6-metoxy-1,4-benzoquinol methylase